MTKQQVVRAVNRWKQVAGFMHRGRNRVEKVLPTCIAECVTTRKCLVIVSIVAPMQAHRWWSRKCDAEGWHLWFSPPLCCMMPACRQSLHASSQKLAVCRHDHYLQLHYRNQVGKRAMLKFSKVLQAQGWRTFHTWYQRRCPAQQQQLRDCAHCGDCRLERLRVGKAGMGRVLNKELAMAWLMWREDVYLPTVNQVRG